MTHQNPQYMSLHQSLNTVSTPDLLLGSSLFPSQPSQQGTDITTHTDSQATTMVFNQPLHTSSQSAFTQVSQLSPSIDLHHSPQTPTNTGIKRTRSQMDSDHPGSLHPPRKRNRTAEEQGRSDSLPHSTQAVDEASTDPSAGSQQGFAPHTPSLGSRLPHLRLLRGGAPQPQPQAQAQTSVPRPPTTPTSAHRPPLAPRMGVSQYSQALSQGSSQMRTQPSQTSQPSQRSSTAGSTSRYKPRSRDGSSKLIDYTRKLLCQLASTSERTAEGYPRVDRDTLERVCDIPKRRLYDVTNPLETLGFVKRCKGRIAWVGGDLGLFDFVPKDALNVANPPVINDPDRASHIETMLIKPTSSRQLSGLRGRVAELRARHQRETIDLIKDGLNWISYRDVDIAVRGILRETAQGSTLPGYEAPSPSLHHPANPSGMPHPQPHMHPGTGHTQPGVGQHHRRGLSTTVEERDKAAALLVGGGQPTVIGIPGSRDTELNVNLGPVGQRSVVAVTSTKPLFVEVVAAKNMQIRPHRDYGMLPSLHYDVLTPKQDYRHSSVDPPHSVGPHRTPGSVAAALSLDLPASRARTAVYSGGLHQQQHGSSTLPVNTTTTTASGGVLPSQIAVPKNFITSDPFRTPMITDLSEIGVERTAGASGDPLFGDRAVTPLSSELLTPCFTDRLTPWGGVDMPFL
eukprot:gnl/Dysnectes_brevis/7596_a12883_219.p1 GENE.gnl/Dysnectes_brevis/7596_a12883_219~~gnl/Dysnectes_brevis/7596_a12883_219.p1  ORF type:complete len:683 (+),score=116.94 gnl/Dysnectes_brevis/7596_a12883_219:45-2093(+)